MWRVAGAAKFEMRKAKSGNNICGLGVSAVKHPWVIEISLPQRRRGPGRALGGRWERKVEREIEARRVNPLNYLICDGPWRWGGC